MRKVLISAALAASTLAIAAPAAAQWQQPVPQPGYANPYGYGYGYRDYGWGNSQAYHNRITQIENQIRNLSGRNGLSRQEASKLLSDSAAMHRRVDNLSRAGLQSNEARDLQYRIQRLEQKVFKESNDRDGVAGRPYGQYGNPYGQYGNQYGYGNNYNYGNSANYNDFRRDLSMIQRQIEDGYRSGALDNREVGQLRNDYYNVDRALQKYGSNGMSQQERWDMNRRINALRVSLQRSATDSDRR